MSDLWNCKSRLVDYQSDTEPLSHLIGKLSSICAYYGSHLSSSRPSTGYKAQGETCNLHCSTKTAFVT